MSIDRSTFLPGVMLGHHLSTFLKSKLILYRWSKSIVFDQLKCTAESCQKINKEYQNSYMTSYKMTKSYSSAGKLCFISWMKLFADPWRGMGGREGNDEAFFGPVIFLQ